MPIVIEDGDASEEDLSNMCSDIDQGSGQSAWDGDSSVIPMVAMIGRGRRACWRQECGCVFCVGDGFEVRQWFPQRCVVGVVCIAFVDTKIMVGVVVWITNVKWLAIFECDVSVGCLVKDANNKD